MGHSTAIITVQGTTENTMLIKCKYSVPKSVNEGAGCLHCNDQIYCDLNEAQNQDGSKRGQLGRDVWCQHG